jgi:hypothetical protein
MAGLLLCAAALAGSAGAAELSIHFSAIRKVLSQQVFTQDGRRYLRGTPAAKCSFAYLENPQIGGDNGVLNIHARFTGRSALDVFGKCIGLGDSFDVLITASPYSQDGVLRLKDVRVEGKGKDGFYIRRVCSSLGQSLRNQFAYRVADDAKAMLERTPDGTVYSQQLRRFAIPSIRVGPEAVVLTVDFALDVR